MIGPVPASLRGPASAGIIDASAWLAERWDALAAKSEYGEAFQSHAWGLSKAALGWRALRVVVEQAGQPVVRTGLVTAASVELRHDRWIRELLRLWPLRLYGVPAV